MFSFGVSVCTQTRQVEYQRCSRTGRVQKNHNIFRKKHTIFYEHPVLSMLFLNAWRIIEKFPVVLNESVYFLSNFVKLEDGILNYIN